MPQLDAFGIVAENLGRSLAFYRLLDLIPRRGRNEPHTETAIAGGVRLMFDPVSTTSSASSSPRRKRSPPADDEPASVSRTSVSHGEARKSLAQPRWSPTEVARSRSPRRCADRQPASRRKRHDGARGADGGSGTTGEQAHAPCWCSGSVLRVLPDLPSASAADSPACRLSMAGSSCSNPSAGRDRAACRCAHPGSGRRGPCFTWARAAYPAQRCVQPLRPCSRERCLRASYPPRGDLCDTPAFLLLIQRGRRIGGPRVLLFWLTHAGWRDD